MTSQVAQEDLRNEGQGMAFHIDYSVSMEVVFSLDGKEAGVGR